MSHYFCDLSKDPMTMDCTVCLPCIQKGCYPKSRCKVLPHWNFPVAAVKVEMSIQHVSQITSRSFRTKVSIDQIVVVPDFQYGYVQRYSQNVLASLTAGNSEAKFNWPTSLLAETEKARWKPILAEVGNALSLTSVEMFDDKDRPMEAELKSAFFKTYAFDFQPSVVKLPGRRKLAAYGLWAGEMSVGWLDNVTVHWEASSYLSMPMVMDVRKFPFDHQELSIVIELPFAPGDYHFLTGMAYPDIEFVPASGGSSVNAWISESAMASWPGEWQVHSVTPVKEKIDRKMRCILKVDVVRRPGFMFVRYFVPLWMLAVSSLTAFFVAPAQAMPRFAATYIAFLSLQGFRTYSQGLVPDGSVVAWIDACNFHSLAFSICCILANTATQVISQRYSSYVAKKFDSICRWFLPISYAVGQAALFGLTEMDPMTLVMIVIVMTTLMLISGIALLRYMSRNVHYMVFRHFANEKAGDVELDKTEARIIFTRLDEDDSGLVSPLELLYHLRAALGKKRCPLSDEELHELAVDEFGEDHEEEAQMDLEAFIKDHKKILRAITSRVKNHTKRVTFCSQQGERLDRVNDVALMQAEDANGLDEPSDREKLEEVGKNVDDIQQPPFKIVV